MKVKWEFFFHFSFFTFLLLACTNPFVEKVLQIEEKTPTQVSYTVTFESNDGSPVDSQTVAEGKTATRPDNPTQYGYGFVNWYDNEELTEPHYDFNTPVTGNITLYAKWNQIFYSVIFMDGETEIDSQIVGEGGTASRPAGNPERGGYLFDNWYGNPDLVAVYDFDTPVTDHITLYAKWMPAYTVTFMDGSTPLSVLTQTIASGSTVSRPPANPTKDGYVFYNWYKDGGLITPFDFSTPITVDTTLYAGWSSEEFMSGTHINHIFDISDPSEWASAVGDIIDNGNDKNYVINVLKDFSVMGHLAATFGSIRDVTVSLRGTGRTLTVSDNGSILRIGSDQAVILRDLTLRGTTGNSVFLVNVDNNGTLVMHGGEISGSNIGVIGQTGSGVYNSDTFNIVTGTIYGSGEGGTSENTMALYRQDGTVEYGTFSGNVWNRNGSLTATSYTDTIRVLNGVLQPIFIGVVANGFPSLTSSALILTFTGAIPGLSADDIELSGVDGIKWGQLSGTGPQYTLPIGGFTQGGILTVSVSKEGFAISGSTKTALIYYSSDTHSVEMAEIPAGTFTMGSPESEPSRLFHETQHEVTLTQGFYMGKYPVTQVQYEAVMGSNPSTFSSTGIYASSVAGLDTGNFPVECVSWYDAMVFCNRLSMREGLSPAYCINGSTDPVVWGPVPMQNRPGFNDATWDSVEVVAGSNGYRLPTEAQWEYACRAETTTAYNWGDTISGDNAWYEVNPGAYPYLYAVTRETGLKPPNAWGLYDMHGNVSEWCWDWFDDYGIGPQTDPTGAAWGDERTRRGGSVGAGDSQLRSAFRDYDNPGDRGTTVGFRVVLPKEK
jgi:uncharacterized repeat protein (TIGR02543 family)